MTDSDRDRVVEVAVKRARKRCRTCGAPVYGTVRFCMTCGQPLSVAAGARGRGVITRLTSSATPR